jgi:predicted metal-dependent hydrolase
MQLSVPSLDIGSRQIRYSILRGNSRRYTYFRFTPDLTLQVVLPRGRSVDLNSAIRSRQDWILSKYEEMSKTKQVLDEQTVMFDGAHLRIVYEQSMEKEGVEPRPEGGYVVIRATDPSRTPELVRRWFIRETSRYVVSKLSELAGIVSAKYRRADVREMGHWGYCTRDGRLAFNWQLIALPERVREYVIFHELTHLSEFNHSQAFKRKLRAVCPDYRETEKELDQITAFKLGTSYDI